MKKQRSHFVGWEVEMLLTADEAPWQCKITNSFMEDGVLFYLVEFDSLELFVNSKDICWVRRLKQLKDKPTARIFRFTKNQPALTVVK